MNVLRVCLLIFGLSIFANAEELKTAAQYSFPKYYKNKDGKTAGICVDIIHAIENVDPTIKVNGYQEFLPFKRLQFYLINGKLDVFFWVKKE